MIWWIIVYLVIGILTWKVTIDITIESAYDNLRMKYGEEAAIELEKRVAKTQIATKRVYPLLAIIFSLILFGLWPITTAGVSIYYLIELWSIQKEWKAKV